MNSDIAISVQNVSKTFRIPHEKVTSLRSAAVGVFSRKRGYEEFKALDDVSFEVKKGEFFGIIGRNGSGKSTLLKILAGIYQPDKGKIKIDGMISPFLELGIGFNPELSGRDNIYLNATVLGMTKKQIDKKFDSIVKFSELERFIDQKLKNYSSGMQVRLAFSVSIHANRDILLMDEVLAVGDTNFQNKCLAEFNRYRNMGKTVVLVTHDIATARKYCDRMLLLRDGKIVMIGDTEDVGDRYIYQNMSDEELRVLKKDNDNSADKNLGKKNNTHKTAVEIVDVKLLDDNGKERQVFKTGDNISVKIFFNKNKVIDELNFGVGLYSDSNSYILGYNTQVDWYKISKVKKDVILKFKNIPLLQGMYYLSFVCFGDVEQKYYDFKPKFRKINIYSDGIKNNYRGVLDVEHIWG